MMEHRISIRKAISLQVALYCDRIGMLRCKTRNISLEGMFLETGRVSIPVYSPVEAVIVLHDGEGSKLHRLQAHVVRASTEGLGLMFRNIDIASFRFLRHLVTPA